VEGLPGKSFEAIVLGGVDQVIREQIWDSKPAGIEAHGAVIGTITDSQGIVHTIKFSRPTSVPIWIDVTVTVDPLVFPSDGAARIKQAIVDFGDAFALGQDVIRSQLFCPIQDVPGVLDVTLLELGTAPFPAGTVNLPMATRQLAAFDTSRIVVVVV
jgi:uncharacterized phage protein gp47/JayE